MHLIFCLDESDGLSFCGRRLSQDREVYAHVLRLSEGHALWAAPSSAGLFPKGSVLVDPEFLKKASGGEYCFVETLNGADAVTGLESVILYYWNRRYPSTEKFSRKLLAGMQRSYAEDFQGNSHEKITMERYTL